MGMEEEEEQNKKGKSPSVLKLFRMADNVDRWLLLWGTIGSIADGLMNPLTMLTLSRLLNTYGAASGSLSYHIVNEYAVKLMYVALVVGTGAFIEGVCWTRTAERQTSRMRMEYLKNILRQDVGFFDTNVTATTSEVTTSISADAHVIQDALSEKMPNFIVGVSTFVSSLIAALLLSWRLSLAAFPFSLLFIVPGVKCGKHMMEVAMKKTEAYRAAAVTAEQAVSSIRTVVSYVAECQTLKKFSHELESSMELGVKQGFLKGVATGSIGIIYAIWAFQAWLGSILVTKKGAQGGHVFMASICNLIGGMYALFSLLSIVLLFCKLILCSIVHFLYCTVLNASSPQKLKLLRKAPTIHIKRHQNSHTHAYRPASGMGTKGVHSQD